MSQMTPSILRESLLHAERVKKSDVMSFASASDIDSSGVIYSLLLDRSFVRKIEPELNVDEVQDFLRIYFKRCIVADPQSTWADSRYSACWDVANWLLRMQDSNELSDGALLLWKSWLESIYIEGDADVRKALETALLEHIFINRTLFRAFSSWENAPQLKEAYEACSP